MKEQLSKTEVETLSIIYNHELSRMKRKIYKRAERSGFHFEDQMEEVRYLLAMRRLFKYIETIPNAVKLRLVQMGHRDIINVRLTINRKGQKEET